MQLTIQNNKLVILDRFGNYETIHVNHTSNDIQDIREDSYKPFIVAEEVSNFARLHLLTASSEDEALQNIDEYIRENEPQEVEEEGGTHLIGAFELDIVNETPRKGDIVTTNDGKQYRILNKYNDDLNKIQAIEYSKNNFQIYPRIKLINLKDIKL